MVDGEARLYYWGVNGEHYSPHNASFGLATMDASRLAGVRIKEQGASSALVKSVPLVVTGRHLVVTADANSGDSGIIVKLLPVAGAGTEGNVTANVTDAIVIADLPPALVGRNCTVEFELRGKAQLFSFGFAA